MCYRTQEQRTMIEIDVDIPATLERATIPALVEQECRDEHLSIAERTTLAAYPGCVHWHLKRGKERGTLEITWWERTDRLWFKVASNRTAPWIEPTIARLKARLEQAP
jgi:hypothetical protein